MPVVCTSRSAMPAALIAATTLSICAALARIAELASAAWVTTPADTVAISGTRLASACAETESRVPSVGTAYAGIPAFWAQAAVIVAPKARAVASSSGRNIRWGMVFSVIDGNKGGGGHVARG